jgi:hypothetical protein
MAILEKMMDRHELDRGDAELLQMLDDRRRGQAGVGAAQFLRDVGVELRQAFHVRFVDDRVVPLVRRPLFAAPVERFVRDDAQRGESCAVAFVEGEVAFVVADRVSKK